MGAATAVIGTAEGLSKFFEGRAMQRKAQKLIENFRWQDLNNAFDATSVSTMGADLRREEAARSAATSVEALQSGGARTLLAGIGGVQQQNISVNREIAANLDEQRKALDYAKAQDEAKMRDMIEKRQFDELQGYGQMMNVGMGLKYQGMDTLLNTAGYVSQMDLSSAITAMKGLKVG